MINVLKINCGLLPITSSSSNPLVSLGWTRDGSTVTDDVTPGTEDGDHNAKVSTSQLRFRAQKQNKKTLILIEIYVCDLKKSIQS